MNPCSCKRQKIYVRLKSSTDSNSVVFDFSFSAQGAFVESSLRNLDFEYFCKVHDVEILTDPVQRFG